MSGITKSLETGGKGLGLNPEVCNCLGEFRHVDSSSHAVSFYPASSWKKIKVQLTRLFEGLYDL